jgi:hypothetical protein
MALREAAAVLQRTGYVGQGTRGGKWPYRRLPNSQQNALPQERVAVPFILLKKRKVTVPLTQVS